MPGSPMQERAADSLVLTEGRFARFETIEWWDQSRLANAKVLVIGAGALGNETVKNLALLGVGNLVLVDMDRIEESNLSRSVLFRATDEGQLKSECGVRAAQEIYPSMRAMAIAGNVLSDLGLGFFRWADVVVGALDNREARVFVNSACARVGRPWIDGGLDVLQGIVRGFAPPRTACYECTMNKTDWELINKRRSCSLLARRAAAAGRTPTTPTVASIIGAIQAQEVVKHLHGMDALFGKGYVYEGRFHSSYNVSYPVSPDCPWHDPESPVVALPELTSAVPLSRVWAEAEGRLGKLDAIDLSRELVESVQCPRCHVTRAVFRQTESVPEGSLTCPECQVEQVPRFQHSIPARSPMLAKSAAELGLPRWDVLWARSGSQILGLELSGDDPTGTMRRRQTGAEEEGQGDGIRQKI